MPAQDSVFLRPLKPTQVIEKLCNLGTTTFANQQITMEINFNFSTFDQRLTAHANDLLVQIAPIVNIAKRPWCEVLSISIATPNNYSHRQQQIKYTLDHAYQARIQLVSISDQNEAQRTLQFIADNFELASELQLLHENIPKPQQEALQAQEMAVASLSRAVSTIAEHNLDQIAKQNEFILRATAELQLRFEEQERKRQEALQQRLRELEERRAALDDEHREKLNALEQQEHDLAKRIREVDLRENTVVRRTLLTDMKGLLDKQQEFSLSKNTTGKRAAVWALFGATFAITAALTLTFGYKFLSTQELRYLLSTSASTIALISTLIWCIRWNDQWFKEHARAEIRNKRFATDILRASWLAELFFETKDKEVHIPEALVAELSRGLFQDEPVTETPHPADAMVELVRKITSVKMGGGAVEITKSPK